MTIKRSAQSHFVDECATGGPLARNIANNRAGGWRKLKAEMEDKR